MARPWCCNDVSFSLAEGETLALLGRNGTGKTTLMDTLAGATRQHGGRIALGGVMLNRLASHERAAGGHRLGAAGAQHLQVAHGAREPDRRRPAHRAGHARVPGRPSASTRCSRAWPSARPTWAPSCPGASSRCWPSAARWCSTRGCCCSTSRWKGWRPSSSKNCCAPLPASRATKASRPSSWSNTRRPSWPSATARWCSITAMWCTAARRLTLARTT